MYREIPVQSRLIQKKLDQKESIRQQKKLKDVKVTVDSQWDDLTRVQTAPGPSRKDQLAYTRFIEIERANRILLQKMGRIMQSNYSSAVKNTTLKPVPKSHSLNIKVRKDNLKRISKENSSMLQRLLKGKSTFSVTNWEKQFKTRRTKLENFGLYPYILDQRCKSESENFDSFVSAWQSSTKIDQPSNQNQSSSNVRNMVGSKFSSTNQSTFSGGFNTINKYTAQDNQEYYKNMIQQTLDYSPRPKRPFGSFSMDKNQTLSPSMTNTLTQSPQMSLKRHKNEFNSYEPSMSQISKSWVDQNIVQQSQFCNQKKLTESRTVINRQASILDENRVVLYKKGKQMGNGYYIVEISSNNTHVFIIAFNVERPQSLLLEIPEKKARPILDQFSHNFEYLASCLKVVNDTKLILLNPHYNPYASSPVQSPSKEVEKAITQDFQTMSAPVGDFNTITSSCDDGSKHQTPTRLWKPKIKSQSSQGIGTRRIIRPNKYSKNSSNFVGSDRVRSHEKYAQEPYVVQSPRSNLKKVANDFYLRRSSQKINQIGAVKNLDQYGQASQTHDAGFSQPRSQQVINKQKQFYSQYGNNCSRPTKVKPKRAPVVRSQRKAKNLSRRLSPIKHKRPKQIVLEDVNNSRVDFEAQDQHQQQDHIDIIVTRDQDSQQTAQVAPNELFDDNNTMLPETLDGSGNVQTAFQESQQSAEQTQVDQMRILESQNEENGQTIISGSHPVEQIVSEGPEVNSNSPNISQKQTSLQGQSEQGQDQLQTPQVATVMTSSDIDAAGSTLEQEQLRQSNQQTSYADDKFGTETQSIPGGTIKDQNNSQIESVPVIGEDAEASLGVKIQNQSQEFEKSKTVSSDDKSSEDHKSELTKVKQIIDDQSNIQDVAVFEKLPSVSGDTNSNLSGIPSRLPDQPKTAYNDQTSNLDIQPETGPLYSTQDIQREVKQDFDSTVQSEIIKHSSKDITPVHMRKSRQAVNDSGLEKASKSAHQYSDNAASVSQREAVVSQRSKESSFHMSKQTDLSPRELVVQQANLPVYIQEQKEQLESSSDCEQVSDHKTQEDSKPQKRLKSFSVQIKLEDLKNEDTFSKSDPYVVVNGLRKDEKVLVHKTETVDNNLNPLFNSFAVSLDDFSEFEFMVYDKDIVSDDQMAYVRVATSIVVNAATKNLPFEIALLGNKGQTKGHGKMILQFENQVYE